MRAYKGFDKDLKCRGFQYEIGKTYETDAARLCECGFHACTDPCDCFGYYHPSQSRYCVVELEGCTNERREDSKVCGKRITILREITIDEMVAASVNMRRGKRVTRDCGTASATGFCGTASATGYCGAANATCDHGSANATGSHGAANATGSHGVANAKGLRGVANATGSHGAANATGSHGVANATGDCGTASATGLYGVASATGDKSIAIASGRRCAASGAVGTYLVLVERDDDWNIVGISTVKVDGKRYKPYTYYIRKNGSVCREEVSNVHN